jgi:hypothetical protein
MQAAADEKSLERTGGEKRASAPTSDLSVFEISVKTKQLRTKPLRLLEEWEVR